MSELGGSVDIISKNRINSSQLICWCKVLCSNLIFCKMCKYFYNCWDSSITCIFGTSMKNASKWVQSTNNPTFGLVALEIFLSYLINIIIFPLMPVQAGIALNLYAGLWWFSDIFIPRSLCRYCENLICKKLVCFAFYCNF